MKIVLLGYMGSGKSVVGEQLATTLNYSFLDLDNEIEKNAGMPISNLFSEKGEIWFRRKENEILKEIIQQDPKLVLATGGGTPCYGDSSSFIQLEKDVISIYLKTSLDELTHRLFSETTHRPLIAHLESKEALKDFIRKHLFERAHYYNQADLVIETDGKPVNAIVEIIVARLF
ncbi:shikimate kinase [Constantimarinum furrinae]|uniref:Shikimate kinase n=1 Tax=Constantimarinum furrinae TaxID=2562285 RepID=A0A7G8PQL9_9FLAO|nr:shikimate kinase [Constantimarinum furrinae]QNJ96635.1 Shikimate kinase [Constantimarinum furrinae]